MDIASEGPLKMEKSNARLGSGTRMVAAVGIYPDSNKYAAKKSVRGPIPSASIDLTMDMQQHHMQKEVSTKKSGKLHQNVFFVAALQLLDQHQQTDGRMLPTDTLLAGYLRKSKDRPIPIFNEHYVVLADGSISYCARKNKSGALNEKQKKVILNTRCLCRAIESPRFQQKYTFEVISSDLKRIIFATKSEEERLIWIHAVHKAMQSSVGAKNSAFAPGSFIDQEDVRTFLGTQMAIRATNDRANYLCYLDDLQAGITLPLEWVKQLNGSNKKNGTVEQMLKDLSRDTVTINGKIVSGELGADVIIEELVHCLLQISATSVQHTLSEAAALKVARDIFLACNRTQVGGDTFEAVTSLCKNDVVVICPSSLQVAPMNISVRLEEVETALPVCTSPTKTPQIEKSERKTYRHKYSSSADLASMANALAGRIKDDFCINSSKTSTKTSKCEASIPVVQGHTLQLQISVQACTAYNICDADPQGDSMDTWASIEATFAQGFTYASFYGAVPDEGSINLKFILSSIS